MAQEMAWFDNANNNAGEIMSRLSQDVSSLQGNRSAKNVDLGVPERLSEAASKLFLV